MTNLTPEMIEKAKTAQTAEELFALAKENNIELTEEEAKTYFEQLNPKSGKLDDDELENIAGGGCGSKKKKLRDYGFASGAVVVDISGKYRCRYNCEESQNVSGYKAYKIWDNTDGTWYAECAYCHVDLTNKFSGDPRDYGFVHISDV